MTQDSETAPYWTKRVLTTDDAVKYTGLEKSTIRSMTSKRVIPHSKPTARTVYFDRLKLENWMLSNPVPSMAETMQDAIDYVARSADRKVKTKRKT